MEQLTLTKCLELLGTSGPLVFLVVILMWQNQKEQQENKKLINQIIKDLLNKIS